MTRFAIHRSNWPGLDGQALGAFLSHVEAPDLTAARTLAAAKYRALAVVVLPDPEPRALERAIRQAPRVRYQPTTEEP